MGKYFSPVASALILKQRAKASKALSNARQRCQNPKNKDFANYGALGIQMLIGDVDQLIDAIGLPSLDASLDRINPYGHYVIGNVRWADKAIQAINKKANPFAGTPSIAQLVKETKLEMASESSRGVVARAWKAMIGSFNAGYIGSSDAAFLTAELKVSGSLSATFDLNQQYDFASEPGAFHLPALSFPNARVRARGGPFRPCNCSRPCSMRGIVHDLRDLLLTGYLPSWACEALKRSRAEGAIGQSWIGRPSPASLLSGWFEIWMLSAASRFRAEHYSAFYPALLLLQELDELGHPANWDRVRSPALDAEFLFVPDFQLDCGPWGELSTFHKNALFRLLEYRRDLGLVSIVGLQDAGKLLPHQRRLLLGTFEAIFDFPEPDPLELPQPEPFERSFRPLGLAQESISSLATYPGGVNLVG